MAVLKFGSPEWRAKYSKKGKKSGKKSSKKSAKKPKLGTGARFAALTKKLSKKKGIYNPAGLAAAIGRKKYGKKRMASMAAKGRKQA